MRVMIAEDERLAREELLYLLSQEEDVELLPWADSGPRLLELAAAHEPDVVFLDIHMPGFDGVETAERLLRSQRPPYIVFATAYEQYALDAFRLEAVDYLLKPYDEERLRQTLRRVRQRLSAARSAHSPGASAPFAPPKPPTGGVKPRLLIDDGSRMVVVDPESVAYAAKEEKWTRLYLTDGQVFATKLTLQELEERLSGAAFFRTHRSNLVNLNCIDELEPWFNGAYNILLKDAKRSRIPLARGAVKELMNRLQGL